MISRSVRFPTLANEIWRTEGWFKNGILALVGVALITVAAKVNIPFHPVPMTMQTFVILALGMVYGRWLGASTVMLYLVAGALGLPVFSGTPEKGVGFVYMMGPTGGYLVGFVIAAAVTGGLAEKGWDRKMTTTFAAMLIGNMIIYVPGLLWLGSLFGWDNPIFAWGALPFLWGDLFKIVLAMIVIPGAWKAVKNNRIKMN